MYLKAFVMYISA